MGVTVKVATCGPLRDSSLTLPDRGLVAIIGPSLSGKSLLESAISSAAFASLLVSDSRLLGALGDRLRSDRWGELYAEVDPLEYLTAELETKSGEEYLQRLNELVRVRTGNLMGVREYLARTAFAADVCAGRGIDCWVKEKTPALLEIDLTIAGPSGEIPVRARLPVPHPKSVGPKELARYVELGVMQDAVGLNVGIPNSFIRAVYAEETTRASPSSIFARALLRKYRYETDPEAYGKLREMLLESWREISMYEISQDEIAFLEIEGKPAVSIAEKLFPWDITSEGFINLLCHWLLCRLIPLLAFEGKKVIVGLEEPEAHLDPYVAYKLPELYSVLTRKWGATIVFTTHSEALVKGIEDAVSRKVLKPDEVRVYETVGRGKEFTLRECPITEEGLIEGSRFTKIAWKIIKGA